MWRGRVVAGCDSLSPSDPHWDSSIELYALKDLAGFHSPKVDSYFQKRCNLVSCPARLN